MATADDFIGLLAQWIGTQEEPPGSNCTWIGKRFGLNCAAWCAITDSEALTEVGIPLHMPAVIQIVNKAKAGRDGWRWITNPADIRRGDLVCLDRGGRGNWADMHIAAVEAPALPYINCIDGNWGNAVVRVRRSATYQVMGYARPPFTDAPASGGGGTPTVYRVGSVGGGVRNVQQLMANTVAPGLPVDGEYGDRTRLAVEQWQMNLGITVDGKWGPATQRATEELFAFLAAQNRGPDGGLLEWLGYAANSVLHPQRRAQLDPAVVRFAQTLLAQRGYYRGNVDGDYGPATTQAVARYQRDIQQFFRLNPQTFPVDGVLGAQTWWWLTRPTS